MATVAEMLALAWQYQQAGHLAPAEQLCQQILQADSGDADAHHLWGIVAYQRGRLQDAVASIRQAIALDSSVPAFHSNLGLTFEGLGQLPQAAVHYQQSLTLDPTGADAHNNLGHVLHGLGRMEESEHHCRQAVFYRPEFPEAHNNLGLALVGQGRLDEAMICFLRALEINPYYGEACNSVGTVLEQQDKLDEARQWYEQALRLQPGFVAAQNNMGNLCKYRGHLQEALAWYEQALQANPNNVQVRFNRALVHLLLGDFAQGWAEYEWRKAHPRIKVRHFPQPQWAGSALEGKTILIHAEQGFGDTIQFIRYVPLVKERGGRVLVECQPQLERVLTTAPGIDQLFAQGAELPAFDVQAPLLSLPGIFQTTLKTIPAPIPYLQAAANLVARWQRELDERTPHAEREDGHILTRSVRSTLKVGIAWQGRPTMPGDRQRSIPLTRFARLAAVNDVQLVSLQQGAGTDQLDGVAGQFSVIDLGSRFDAASFADLAAALMCCDLVITVDTAVAHLAGALGIPVWVALPLVPDWRWLLQRTDSPWYPTMRLFRQSRLGDWGDVFQRLAAELEQLVRTGNGK